MSRIVAIVGATATGKTELGEALAAALDGEVVCADSRQVFGELEIGTGKPAPAERAARPHHLFDARTLDHRVPVLVGGSGLYLDAAMRGLAPQPPHDPALRARLRAELERDGASALHRRLAALDPPTAARLDPRDAQRVVRALEVVTASDRPLSSWHAAGREGAVTGAWVVFELTCPARELGPRIERRTRAMFDAGLVEETRALVAAGRRAPLERLRAVGYDEALALLDGGLTRAAAEARVNLRAHPPARQAPAHLVPPPDRAGRPHRRPRRRP